MLLEPNIPQHVHPLLLKQNMPRTPPHRHRHGRHPPRLRRPGLPPHPRRSPRRRAPGIEIVIATGRRHSYAMKVLRALSLNPANALVSSNGTVVRTIGSDLLHRTHLPTTTARWLCTHLDDFRNTLVLTFDTVGPNGEDTRGALVVEGTPNTPGDLHPSIGQLDARQRALHRARRVPRICPRHRPAHPDDDLRHRRPHAPGRSQPPRTPASSPPSVPHRTRTPPGPPKSPSTAPSTPTATSASSTSSPPAAPRPPPSNSSPQHRGISTSEILAIGDNWNDLSMLELAGQSILMSNAPEDLKQLARERGWTIGPSNDEDGVAHAIESAIQSRPLLVL